MGRKTGTCHIPLKIRHQEFSRDAKSRWGWVIRFRNEVTEARFMKNERYRRMKLSDRRRKLLKIKTMKLGVDKGTLHG